MVSSTVTTELLEIQFHVSKARKLVMFSNIAVQKNFLHLLIAQFY